MRDLYLWFLKLSDRRLPREALSFTSDRVHEDFGKKVRFVLFFVTFAVLESMTTGNGFADSVKPTTAAVTAYQQGQAYERLFEDINLSPAACAIVLERAQCASDLQLISSMRGQDPTDAQVQKWFSTGDIALRIENWNGMYVPDKAWADNPVFAWWYTAGVVSIAASLPRGGPLDEYLGHYAGELVKHASAAPDNSSNWEPTGSNPVASLASMQSRLQQVFPVVPYPEPSFGNGAAAYAQLGVYVSTLQQLVDNPPALSRPASRAFAAAALARLQALHTKFADGLTAAPLQNAVNQPIILDREWLNTAWREPLSKSINTKWPEKPRKAFLIGALVAQAAYNAAALKDPNSDTAFRGALATLPAWNGISAKTRADITALQGVPYASKGGKWEDINSAAAAVILDIVNEK